MSEVAVKAQGGYGTPPFALADQARMRLTCINPLLAKDALVLKPKHEHQDDNVTYDSYATAALFKNRWFSRR